MSSRRGNGLCQLVFAPPHPLVAAAAVWAAVSLCRQVCLAQPEQGDPLRFDGAQWVWFAGDRGKMPAATRYFRKAIELPTTPKPTKAEIILTADNEWTLYINGTFAAESDLGGGAWHAAKKLDVTPLLRPGRNVIAIEAVNILPGPAGLIATAVARYEEREPVVLRTDPTWRCSDGTLEPWTDPGFDDTAWDAAMSVGTYGSRPWGTLADPVSVRLGAGMAQLTEPNIKGAVLFVRGNVSKAHHFAFTVPGPNGKPRSIRNRAYPENDVPAPSVPGRQLHVLAPPTPKTKPKLLFDAGQGTLGSPSVSYDGKTVYFAMAPGGDAFYHLYSIPAAGGEPSQLTNGTFHDYDPEPLPDGRIAFSSTRIGSREEYHGNLASSIFVMDTDGTSIQPLTYHIVADREPRVTAHGSLAVIRSDNFMERAKVETQIHVMRMDGTAGVVQLGNDREAIGYQRAYAIEGPTQPGLLRQNGFGSPAPLRDGRIAALSRDGLVVSTTEAGSGRSIETSLELYDISALPDGRLLCTTYDRKFLGVVDLTSGEVKPFYMSRSRDIHSATFLGPRPRPPHMASVLRDSEDRTLDRTGFLYCQNVLNTKQTNADVHRIKAVRVYEGVPLALRPDHFPYTHIGVEAVELGTVPLAADGSFHAQVPADRALALQAVDGDGRPVINELTWIYVRPGESRSCVGCHSPRTSAPQPAAVGVAARTAPVPLLGQGEPHRFRGNNAELGGILNLQFDRFREAAAIDLYPERPRGVTDTTAAFPPGRPAEVMALTQQLRDASDAALRLSAAQRLAVFREPTTVGPLIQALSDARTEVRMNAALALATCADRTALRPLVNALADAPAVGRAARLALEHLTGETPEPMAADGTPSSDRAWEDVLQQVEDGALQAKRIEELTSERQATVSRAVRALAHIGDSAAGKALREFVRHGIDSDPKQNDARTLMAAVRALGFLCDVEAAALLGDVLRLDTTKTARPVRRRNVHLAAAAAEALGRIGTEEAERTLIECLPTLQEFWHYAQVSGDHPVLVACHSSVLHFRILEALDAMGTQNAEVVPVLLRSVPGDLDRGLLLETDSYENLVARVTQRAGLTPTALETCLSILGDETAVRDERLVDAVNAYPWPLSAAHRTKTFEQLIKTGRGGLAYIPYSPAMRAAQTISVLMLDDRLAPRVAAAFERFRSMDVPDATQNYGAARDRSWVCFYLARALGKTRHRASLGILLDALEDGPPELACGHRTPPSAIIYEPVTPFYRAAVAFALGRLGDARAIPCLLNAVTDMNNALDVRHSAARALRLLGQDNHVDGLQALAESYPEVMTRRVLLSACRRAMDTPRRNPAEP